MTHKYGRENVAQIITFGTMAARAVIRDAGRGLDIPYADVDRIAKLVPPELDATIDKALASVPQLRELAEQRPEDPAASRRGAGASKGSRGTPPPTRPAWSSRRPHRRVRAPLPGRRDERHHPVRHGRDRADRAAQDGFPGAQDPDADPRRARSGFARTGVEPLDIGPLPLDDPETYRLFSEARTSGVFQFESSGMQDILRKLKPERFEDLIALNALYRPGPIKGGLIDDFIKRRHGRIEVAYPHPVLEEIAARDLRRHRLPGAGHADRLAGWGASPWARPTCSGARWGRRRKKEMAAEREPSSSPAPRERGIPDEEGDRRSST